MQWADRFVTDVEQYARLVDGELAGLSTEFTQTQLNALQSLLDSAHEFQSLYLVPRLLARDTTGQRAKRLLGALAQRIDRSALLARAIHLGLRTDLPPDQSRLNALRQLDRIADRLGVTLGKTEQIGYLRGSLSRESDRLSAALPRIASFCTKADIPFDGSRKALDQLGLICQVIVAAPEACLHLQHPGLTQPGCHQALLALAGMQAELAALEKELNEYLYLDMVPSTERVWQAVVVLRESHRWYSVFKSSWRSAVATHRRLHRAKSRLKPKERLAHLERLVHLTQLHERWRTDTTWERYLGAGPSIDVQALDDYVNLAGWNERAREALDPLGLNHLLAPDLTSEQLRQLRRDFETVAPWVSNAISALDATATLLPRIANAGAGLSIQKVCEVVSSFMTALDHNFGWLRSNVLDGADFSICLRACEASLEQQSLKADIDNESELIELLGNHFLGADTDVASAMSALRFAERIDSAAMSHAARTWLKSGDPAETARTLYDALDKVAIGFSKIAQQLKGELGTYGSFDAEVWAGRGPKDGILAFAVAFRDKLRAAADSDDALIPWSRYVARRKEATEVGLTAFVELLEANRIPAAELPSTYAYGVYATIVRSVFRAVPQIGRFSGLKHNEIRDEFKRLDREVIGVHGQAIAAECVRAASPPSGRNGARVDDKTEMVLLHHLLPQQRPRVTVRKMLGRAGRAVQSLKPCFMMGPQAVAQYLAPGAVTFDLVIMDEASQLKPEEAIGAIARGQQLVVVGDSKQLPPTSFFSRLGQSVDENDQYATTDAESILDVCSSHFHPTRPLRWHYRSQHHSLIEFSNHQFYRGSLIIFPSPYGQSSRLGVRATYLKDAIYDNQTNLCEAEHVVDAVAVHVTARADESLGIATQRLGAVPEADAFR